MIEGASESLLLKDLTSKAEQENPLNTTEDKNYKGLGIKNLGLQVYRSLIHLRQKKTDGEKAIETAQQLAEEERAKKILKSVREQFLEYATNGTNKVEKFEINKIKQEMAAVADVAEEKKTHKEIQSEIQSKITEQYGNLNFYHVKSDDIIYLGKFNDVYLNYQVHFPTIDRDNPDQWKNGVLFKFEYGQIEDITGENQNFDIYAVPEGQKVEGGRKRKSKKTRKTKRKTKKSRKTRRKSTRRR